MLRGGADPGDRRRLHRRHPGAGRQAPRRGDPPRLEPRLRALAPGRVPLGRLRRLRLGDHHRLRRAARARGHPAVRRGDRAGRRRCDQRVALHGAGERGRPPAGRPPGDQRADHRRAERAAGAEPHRRLLRVQGLPRRRPEAAGVERRRLRLPHAVLGAGQGPGAAGAGDPGQADLQRPQAQLRRAARRPLGAAEPLPLHPAPRAAPLGRPPAAGGGG